MTFAQRRNRLATHFSERIPVVKRRDPSFVVSGVLYGCEIRSVTLGEENKLRVVQSLVLGEMFGSEKEVTCDWRKLHYE